MDYYDVLSALIFNQDGKALKMFGYLNSFMSLRANLRILNHIDCAKDFDDELAQILQKTMPLLSENIETSAKDLSIR
jgi:hypothetical protein